MIASGLKRVSSLLLLDQMRPKKDSFMKEFRQRPGCVPVPVVVITAEDLAGEDRRRLSGNVPRILGKDIASRKQLVGEVRQFLTEQMEFRI